MPARKKNAIAMPTLKETITEIANSKALTVEAVTAALSEALRKAYIKYLDGGDDAVVEVKIDLDKNEIYLAQLKKVVSEVTDDYLEVGVDEINEGLGSEIWKVGDTYPIPATIAELSKVFTNAVKGNLRNELGKAERSALYEIYKDHIGEMITGTVEKADDRSVSVNIGRTTVELTRHEMIGDEFFKIGDPIKVYIQEVKQAQEEGKPSFGSQIEVTRSSEGFLKRLFEEEIHEIYDGTVIIKGVAREAGVRSKVAVYSNNEDVDATGACIGQGGSRIQKIVSQLGNGIDKEKIDIIAYSKNPALFIAESLRPAQALGVKIVDAEALPRPKAIAVVRDEQLSLAIGKKGANARLANKLTGWNIDIMEESLAKEEQIDYVTVEELQKQAEEQKKAEEREAYIKKSQEEAAKKEAEKVEDEAAPEVAPELKEEAAPSIAEEKKEETVVTPVEEKKEEAAPAPVNEEKKEEPEPVKEVVHAEVKTTKSLQELEQELEKAKNKPVTMRGNPKAKRPHKITEEEVEHVKPAETTLTSAMPIYSQEELDQIEQEENENADYDLMDDDEDLDQYDSYYDDDGK